MGWLYAENNKLKTIDFTGCVSLGTVELDNNLLEQLDVRSTPNLQNIFCQYNNMDNDPEKSIIGLGSKLTKRDDTIFIDEECERAFKYWPQNGAVNPTPSPTVEPTAAPTETPTVKPTVMPTITPTVEPTATPTQIPTVEPTEQPTVVPTVMPTVTPKPYNYPYKIVSAKTDNGTIVFSIEKSESAPSAQIIFAEYDSGALKRVQVDNILSDESVSFTKTFEYSGGDYKAFIWDALGTMTPLSESVEYKK